MLGGYGPRTSKIGKHKEWTLIETGVFVFKNEPITEMDSEGKLTVTRTYRFRRAPGSHWEADVFLEVKGWAAYDSNKLPRDAEQVAMTWPAISAGQTATIRVLKGGERGAQLEGDSGHSPGMTLAEIVDSNPLLSHTASPQARLDALMAHLRWREDQSVDEIRLSRLDTKTKRAIAALEAYEAKVKAQEHAAFREDISEVSIRNAESVLEELVADSRGLRTEFARVKAEELANKLRNHLKAIRTIPNPGRAFGQGIPEGFVEFGLMAHDVAYKAADEVGERTGLYDIEWDAKSAIGKMKEQGMGWGEVGYTVFEGFVMELDRVLTAAVEGDFVPLAEFTLELGVDALIPAGAAGKVGTAGKAAGKAAARGGKAVAKGAGKAGKAVGKAAKKTLGDVWADVASAGQRAKQIAGHLPKKAPAWVSEELAAVAKGVSTALAGGMQVVPEAGLMGALKAKQSVLDAISHARLEVTVGRAKESLAGMGHKGLGDGAFDRLQKIAEKEGVSQEKLRKVIKRFGGQEAVGDVPKLMGKLEETLAIADKFEASSFSSMLARSTDAVDPTSYMDSMKWLGGLEPEVRAALAARIAAKKTPDLEWLRNAGIELDELKTIALDPNTNWSDLQKAAAMAEELPSDVRAVIGKKVEDISEAPKDTAFYTPAGMSRKQLRWKANKRGDRGQLTIDSAGRVRVGFGNDLSRALLGQAMRKVEARIPGHQDHHVIPIEVAKNSELFRLARTKGKPPWNPNDARNGIQLAESAKARDAADYAKIEKRPLHEGSHRHYSEEVAARSERVLAALAKKYGGVEKIPPAELTKVAGSLQSQLASELKDWPGEALL